MFTIIDNHEIRKLEEQEKSSWHDITFYTLHWDVGVFDLFLCIPVLTENKPSQLSLEVKNTKYLL